MTPEAAFRLFNGLALAGWLVLVLAPRWRFGRVYIAGTLLPAVFSLAYVFVFVPRLFDSPGGFGSIASLVALLESSPLVMLGAWLHYLAFDLVIGAWMAGEAARRQIGHAPMVPVLVLTFLAGPVGWLSFRMLCMVRGD